MSEALAQQVSFQPTTLEALIDDVFACADFLPKDLRERVLAFGPAAVPSLLEILRNDDLLNETAHGRGWAPIHAVELLADLGAAEATDAMLHTLAKTDYRDIVHDRLIVSMPKLGQAVLEPALRALAQNGDEEFRGSLCAILANLKVRDERIFDLLLQELDRDILSGAIVLGDYGDPRAIPYLSAAFEEYELKDDSPFGNTALFELQDSIELLGGTLTPSQRKKLDEAEQLAEIWRKPLQAALRMRSSGILADNPQPGRNEPCWCGSGKKYKKCHLRADEL